MRGLAVGMSVGLWLCLCSMALAASPDLGILERQALDEALATRGLAVEEAPDGKAIGQVHIVTLEVFSGRDWHFQWFNVFHRTTREGMIRRELLFVPGQAYQQPIIDETTRNLRDVDLSSSVVIVPVKGARPDTVDVLVVTRDVWSLRLNTDFEIQQGEILRLTTSLSENNLFGWRKRASLVFDMDQGTMAFGPSYWDPNIAGTRLTLSASARALFERQTRHAEGSTAGATLSYPLYSLASRWGASLGASHSNAVARSFLGSQLRGVDLRDTPEVEALPWIYRVRQSRVTSNVTRSFGTRFIHRVNLGHQYSVVRPSFTEDFPDDPVLREKTAQQIFPRSERVSDLFAGYFFFTPRYRNYRDFSTFDLTESQRLGPSASASTAWASRALGSDRDFFDLSASIGWTVDWWDGLQSASVGWGGRLQNGQLVDQLYSASVYGASPVIARKLRILASVGASALIDDTRNRFSSLGGDSGLRGYAVNDLFGKASALGHLEVRSMSLNVWSFRLGGLTFVDVGDAATPDPGTGAGVARAVRSLLGLRPRSDVGFGVRLLIPQFNAYVLRADCAFATSSTMLTRAGWPPRISIGFGQAF